MARSIDVPVADEKVEMSTSGISDFAGLSAGFGVLALAAMGGGLAARRLVSAGTAAAGVDDPTNDGDTILI